MKLRMPQALNEIGQRSNQEDSIFPSKGEANESSRLFLVCDGMGGHENGEVASGLVCSTFGACLGDIDHEQFTVDMFESTLSAAYDALDREDPNSESTRKMGTTLTFLHLNDHEVVVAHMGDSRVYHVRPSASQPILYQSSDHSLVNELVRAEIITPEEALTHPRRNVITRAMQPNLESRHKADVRAFNDVLAGDYFFMCSDGVLESLSNDTLVEILRRDVSDQDKIEAIKALCNASSRDNFSAYLVPIAEGLPEVVAEVVHAELADVTVAEVVEDDVPHADYSAPLRDVTPEDPKSGFRLTPTNMALGCVALVAICATLYFAISNSEFRVESKRVVYSNMAPERVSEPSMDCNIIQNMLIGADVDKDAVEADSLKRDNVVVKEVVDSAEVNGVDTEIIAPKGDGPKATQEGGGSGVASDTLVKGIK